MKQRPDTSPILKEARIGSIQFSGAQNEYKAVGIRLYQMDCMDMLRQIPDKYYSLAIVDPPYGIGAGSRKGRHSKGQFAERFEKEKYKTSDWDNSAPGENYWEELFRVSRNQIVWGGNYFTEILPISRGWIFWDKKPIVPNYSDGELAWTSFDKVLKRIEILWNGKIRNAIERGYISIHPTQKPIELYHFCLENYASSGDKILDTHGGSMSIAIACYDLGFDLDLCELDPDYFKAGQARLDAHIAKYAPASEIPVTKKGEIKLF